MAATGDGIKFVMYFTVEGNGEAAMNRIAKAMQGVASSATSAESALDKFGASAAGIQMAFDKIGETGSKMLSIGAAGIKMYAGGVEEMMNSLSPFETSMNRMMMIGKKSREEAVALGRESLDLVRYTPFQADQIMKVQESLAAAKISMDAFKNSSGEAMTLQDAFTQGMTRVDEATLKMAGNMKISTTSTMADLAAFTGQSGYQMTTFVRGMDRALQTGNLRMLFDQVPVAMRQAIFETTGGQMKITAQKAMDNMFKFLSEQGGIGAAAMASSTYEGILSNFKDLPVVLSEAIAKLPGEGGFYDKIKESLAGVYASIQEAIAPNADGSANNFIVALREGFEPVMTLVVEGLKLMSSAIKKFSEIVSNNPGLVKFGTMIGLAGSAMLVLGGAALVAVGSLGGIVAAFVTIATVIAPVLPAVLGIAAGFAAIAAVGIGGMAAAAVAFQKDFGGIKTMLTDVYVIGQAVFDALSDWNGAFASISEESKAALEERGMMGSFLKVINWIRQAQVFFEGFAAGFGARWDGIAAKFGGAWDKMSGAFGRVGDAIRRIIGIMSGGLDQSQALVDKATSNGMEWGDMAASVMEGVAEVAETVAWAVDSAIASAPVMISTFASLYEVVAKVWAVTKGMYNAFAIGGNLVEGAWRNVASVLEIVTESLKGIIVSSLQLAQGDVAAAGKTITASATSVAKLGEEWVKGQLAIGGEIGNNIVGIGEARDDYAAVDTKANQMRNYAGQMAHPGYSIGAAQQATSYAINGSFPVPPAALGPAPARSELSAIDQREKEERLARASSKQPVKVSVEGSTKVILNGREIIDAIWTDMKEKMEEAGFRPAEGTP